MATEESVTGLALQEATNTTNYNKQNVHYKMKYNATTKQWEQEEIMTPLVPMIYPGIRTKDGKTKDISGGLKDAPVVKPPEITQPGFPSEPDKPETPVTAPSTGIGGYQQAQQDYSGQVQGIQKSAGVQYEPNQMNAVSESQRTNRDMKYAVMPGGYNSRSDAQVLSQSGEAGVLRHLLNPTVKKDQSKTMSAIGGLPIIGGVARLAGVLGPRSERDQIERLLKSGMINVTSSDGKSLDYATALKVLTQDDKGRLKILKGEDLINSGYKITQNKTIAEEYKNSPAFMNIKEDKATNMSTLDGVKLTTLNPVMGSAGTTLFGLFDEAKGASQTNGEQVLVVEAGQGHGGGAYRSDGKFVGMNGQIYSRGTADQAMKAANGGHIPLEVLERMTNKDGILKDLYKAGGEFEIDSKYIGTNNKYLGNVVAENGDVITNGGTGNSIANVADPDSNDGRYDDWKNNRWEKPVTPTREEVEAPIREKYDTSRAGTGQQDKQDKQEFVSKPRKKDTPEKEEQRTKRTTSRGAQRGVSGKTTKVTSNKKSSSSNKLPFLS